jgi:hypothetical protein
MFKSRVGHYILGYLTRVALYVVVVVVVVTSGPLLPYARSHTVRRIRGPRARRWGRATDTRPDPRAYLIS